MKDQTTTLILLLLCIAVMADTNPPIPPLCEWDRVIPPPENSTMREMVNHSDFEWAVSIVDNELIITKAQYGNDWTKLPSFLFPDKERRKILGSQYSVIEVADGYRRTDSTIVCVDLLAGLFRWVFISRLESRKGSGEDRG